MSDSKLTRTRVALSLSYTTEHDLDRHTDVAVFAPVDRDTYWNVSVPLTMWDDMGRPDRIEVTVRLVPCGTVSPDLARTRLCAQPLDHDGPHEDDAGLRWSA